MFISCKQLSVLSVIFCKPTARDLLRKPSSWKTGGSREAAGLLWRCLMQILRLFGLLDHPLQMCRCKPSASPDFEHSLLTPLLLRHGSGEDKSFGCCSSLECKRLWEQDLQIVLPSKPFLRKFEATRLIKVLPAGFVHPLAACETLVSTT